MLYGIISDIHSNLPALAASLDRLSKLHVESIICLGDIVGYASEPNECIRLVKENADSVICGNHDAGVVGTTSIDYFNFMAKEAILWTRGRLNSNEDEYLRELPLVSETDDFLLVHASPHNPERWHYVFSRESCSTAFEASEASLIFVGHTHRPVLFQQLDGRLEEHHSSRFELGEGERYLVNTGSVGQPRDGDPRASFVTFSSEKRVVEFHRIPYDIDRAQEGIIDAGLPRELANRLRVGF